MLNLYPLQHRPRRFLMDELRLSLDDFFVHENPWNFHVPQLGPQLAQTENEDGFELRLEVPGFSESEISVTVENNVLTLSGARKAQVPEDYRPVRQERGSLDFAHECPLPNGVDPLKLSAALKNGILTIVLPKDERAKPRKIEINVDSIQKIEGAK